MVLSGSPLAQQYTRQHRLPGKLPKGRFRPEARCLSEKVEAVRHCNGAGVIDFDIPLCLIRQSCHAIALRSFPQTWPTLVHRRRNTGEMIILILITLCALSGSDSGPGCVERS